MATSFLLQLSYVTLIGLTLKIPYAFVKKSHLSYGEPIRETEVWLITYFHFIEEPADKCAKAAGAKPMRRGNSIQIIYLEAE